MKAFLTLNTANGKWTRAPPPHPPPSKFTPFLNIILFSHPDRDTGEQSDPHIEHAKSDQPLTEGHLMTS